MTPESKRFNRRLHYWLAAVVFIPALIVIASGLVLQVKKEFDWVQPPTQRGTLIGSSQPLQLTWAEILAAVRKVPEVEVTQWHDVKKLDIRPGKSVIKVLSHNDWEVQLDASTGRVLQVAYRRSDWIEAIHDGSFFHKHAKLWVFLPAAIILFLMWLTGAIMLLPSLRQKWIKNKRQR